MALDSDLQAVHDKIYDQSGEPFSREERLLVQQILAKSQQDRDEDTSANPSRRRRELDFFIVCLGFCVLGFAIIVLLRWITGTASMDGGGALGLAFLASVSATMLRIYYRQPLTTSDTTFWVKIGIVTVLLLLSLIGLIVAGGIGAVIGVVLGAAFFQACMRYRSTRRIQSTKTESPA